MNLEIEDARETSSLSLDEALKIVTNFCLKEDACEKSETLEEAIRIITLALGELDVLYKM